MELKYGLISADDHVQEHPEVWTQRLSSAKWGGRIPHVERHPDGSERWVVDGSPAPLAGVATAAALLADRAHEPQRWEETPRAAYDPIERLAAMDAGRIDSSVLYPTVPGVGGETFGRITDPDFELACVQAYNDWLIDEWARASDRFIPQCLVPLAPIEGTVAEIRRAVGRGHRGVILPSVPMELRDLPHINEPHWDPVWEVCQELEIPVCFHAGSSAKVQLPVHDGYSPAVGAAFAALARPASTVFVLVNFLLSRILMRFPRLQAVFAESGVAWAAYLLEYADHQFEKDRIFDEGYDLKPSELFRRQCYLTGWYESASMQTRHFIGVDNILWSTNFPLATSTWPNSHNAIRRWATATPADERDRILWGNAARLYKVAVEPRVPSAVSPG